MDKFKTRVLAAQNALKAPKNQRNTFGNYNYRSCEDILEAAKPICKAQNLLLTLSDEVLTVGDRFYIKATASLRDTESDESVTVTAFARESDSKKGMDDSQVTGTASSYARKYALNGLFCVDDTKDADTDAYHKVTTAEAKPEKKPTAEQYKCKSCGALLKPFKDAQGNEVGVMQLARRSEQRFGQVLCMDCINRLYPDAVKK